MIKGHRYLGLARDPEILAIGLDKGERAYQFPGGSTLRRWMTFACPAKEVPGNAVNIIEPVLDGEFDRIPGHIRQRFKYLVQDCPMKELLERYRASCWFQKVKPLDVLTTGEMAEVICLLKPAPGDPPVDLENIEEYVKPKKLPSLFPSLFD